MGLLLQVLMLWSGISIIVGLWAAAYISQASRQDFIPAMAVLTCGNETLSHDKLN